MARSLQASRSLFSKQQRLIAIGLRQAERAWQTRQFAIFTGILSVLQVEAARNGIEAVDEMIAELEFEEVAPVAVTDPLVFGGVTSAGADLQPFLEAAQSLVDLEMAAITQIMDAARIAEGVTITAHETLYGYIRVVNTATCCSRCAVLAGKFYKYSDGFPRHPNCKCGMIPVELAKDYGIMQTPDELFQNGQIHDLTQAERKAISDGADISQVVNVRRKAAGLTEAGRVLERLGRLTPEGIYQLASDRDEAIALLKRFRYLV